LGSGFTKVTAFLTGWLTTVFGFLEAVLTPCFAGGADLGLEGFLFVFFISTRL
jgi:hypothetical protein